MHEVVGFDPQMMVGELTAHTEAARMTWEEEDYLVAAAYDVVLKHAEDVGLRLPTPETDTVTPTGRAGAVSRPPRRPKSRQPSLPPVSVLGRLHRGVAYFAGDAPPTAFAIDADGSVSVVETPGTAPGAPDFMVPCFGPPALLSDTTESLRFLVRYSHRGCRLVGGSAHVLGAVWCLWFARGTSCAAGRAFSARVHTMSALVRGVSAMTCQYRLDMLI